MLVVSTSKTWKIFPVLMACLLAVAAVGCLVHTDGIDAAQTAHHGQRHTPSPSSAHITLDLYCLVAVLPAASIVVWLCLGVLYLAVPVSHPVVTTCPPFLAPRALARSSHPAVKDRA